MMGAFALTIMLAPAMTFANGKKHAKKAKSEHRMHHAKKDKKEATPTK